MFRNKKGFSLVEMAVVLAVIGVLAFITFKAVGAYNKRIDEKKATNTTLAIKEEILLFVTKYYRFPTNAEIQVIVNRETAQNPQARVFVKPLINTLLPAASQSPSKNLLCKASTIGLLHDDAQKSFINPNDSTSGSLPSLITIDYNSRDNITMSRSIISASDIEELLDCKSADIYPDIYAVSLPKFSISSPFEAVFTTKKPDVNNRWCVRYSLAPTGILTGAEENDIINRLFNHLPASPATDRIIYSNQSAAFGGNYGGVCAFAANSAGATVTIRHPVVPPGIATNAQLLTKTIIMEVIVRSSGDNSTKSKIFQVPLVP